MHLICMGWYWTYIRLICTYVLVTTYNTKRNRYAFKKPLFILLNTKYVLVVIGKYFQRGIISILDAEYCLNWMRLNWRSNQRRQVRFLWSEKWSLTVCSGWEVLERHSKWRVGAVGQLLHQNPPPPSNPTMSWNSPWPATQRLDNNYWLSCTTTK